jgi:hypothetical protein
VHVFDFDKTLVNRDTLFGFYKRVNKGRRLFFLKRAILLFCAFLYKAGIISNTRLKRIGVSLFLKGISESKILECAIDYAGGIKLNSIYSDYFLNFPKKERCIVSASFIEYLSFVFPGEMVFGSSLQYYENKVVGLKLNMYGKEKLRCLNDNGFTHINSVFTDSYSDSFLMDISKDVYLVKDCQVFKVSYKVN